MRRKWMAAIAAGGLAFTGGFFFLNSAARSGDNGQQPPIDNPRPAVTNLPIANVTLFSSGVGYFQREGDVQGNARIDMTFPVQDINDLLKSMVLQDLGGGHVSAVSYDSQAPVEKTLRSFAINLTGNPTFGQILNQARGEKVEAVLQQTNNTQPGTMTGVIMGVEHKKESVGKEVVEGEFINLWCAEGMRSVKLGDMQRVRFLNPVMDSEVKKALEALAISHDTQKKAVSLSFSGEGKRSVKVGYVVENPIWKTSYRLVMGKQGKPFLQGWAVVENTQDEDWNNVRMGLVSGRPISFQMDLYQPLFVSRPIVEPELFASLRPPTYQGAMQRDGEQAMQQTGGAGGRNFGQQAPAAKAKEVQEVMRQLSDQARNDKRAPQEAFDPRAGVSSAAVATELGDFFQYKIETPVNLPRQKSAMLPIVNEEVEGSKVSIYNQATHAKFPLLGMKFKNSTKLHLMQGPITVFENNSYAGDARIQDLQPKEERLISYAIDLGTEVEPIVENPKDTVTKIKVVRGVLEATHKIVQSKVYKIKNRTEHDRVVLIEHPYNQQLKLVEPEKPSERARDVYRFEVKVDSGKTGQQKVVEERDILQQVALNNLDDNSIKFFFSQQVITDKVKSAVQQASALKSKLAQVQQELGHRERQLKDIRDDQTRLRANLKEMPPTAAAYKRYLDKFDKQETEIEQLLETIKTLQEKEYQQRKGFEEYLTNLNVE